MNDDTRTLKAFFSGSGEPTFPDGSKLNQTAPNWKNCNWVKYHDPKTKELKGWVEGPPAEIGSLEVEYLKRTPNWNKNILP
jgi:hypothetical protein